MYYKQDDNSLIDQNAARELFKVNPQVLNFSRENPETGHIEQNFTAKYKGKRAEFTLSNEEIITKTIELFTLGSCQCFGVPFPIQDEDHIEIYSGIVLTKEFDLQTEPCNYNVLTTMQT